ncbi:serine/threonine protein kinase [Nitzschia inconspicua]|uniref:cGMP-dependent protein kinase n=1 Tax=Nitzschia inconspicua TaxID=303405 RepID=A0A9K3LC04_9STRA|nr:serine/threonine protein kinase [Nitzschia inconspicua]
MKVPVILEKFKDLGVKTTQEIHDKTMGLLGNVHGKTNKLGGRMKVVFAKPLDVTKNYVMSHQEEVKTDEETQFLHQAFVDSDEFLFSNLSNEERDRLVAAMQLRDVKKGTIVIRQGDLGDYLYVLKEGKLTFLVDGKEVGSADNPGSIFGELALLYDCPRAATVRADTDCVLYRVSQHTFRHIQTAHALENVDVAREVLKKNKMFEGLSDDTIKTVSDSLLRKPFKKGDTIASKGEEVQGLYIIKEGHVKGTNVSIGSTKYADIMFDPGEVFGEGQLISGRPAPADMIATTDCVVWVLTKERFFRILGHLDLKQLIQHVQDIKFLSVIPMFAYSDVDKIEIDQLASRMTGATFPKGTAISTAGQATKPRIFVIKEGSVELSNKTGATKTLGAGEIFGFGGETLILTNRLKKQQQEEGKINAGQADEIGAKALTTEAAIHMAEKNLKNDSVVAQHSCKVTEDLTVRLLTLKDISAVLYDPLRLGKDYRKTAKMNPNLTKEKLERIRLLGAGTFGQVWLTKDTVTEGAYALKIQYKRELIDYNQAEGVIREKRVMERMHHPFVMSIVNAQQDSTCLYMVMELIQGGELRSQMRDYKKPFLEEGPTKFYASCMLEGLSYMHRRHFVYRDLKGENVLIDKDGYCVIVDLGFAKFVPDKTFTFCGTPIFIAPEIILNKGHDKSADIWSLGVLIYEMLYGTNPFFDYDDPNIDQKTLFKRIISGKFEFPKHSKAVVSDKAKDLIEKMLVVDVNKRLGCLSRADLDLRDHPWFRKVNFGKLYRKEIDAPWVPTIKSPFDGENFAKWEEEDKHNLKPLTPKEQHHFEKFC